MNRRGFLKILGLGAVTAAAVPLVTVLDPEKQLWVPGARSYFIPKGDIAIKNVRLATMAETSAVTGQRMLRVTAGQHIQMMTEQEFNRIGFSAFGPHTMDAVEYMTGGINFLAMPTVSVHFDDGTIAHNVKLKNSPTLLEDVRRIARGSDADVARRARQREEERFRRQWVEMPIDQKRVLLNLLNEKFPTVEPPDYTNALHGKAEWTAEHDAFSKVERERQAFMEKFGKGRV